MSKSLGNVLNPLEVIHEHGTDALRLSLLSKSTVGMDKNYSDADTKYYRRFLNKLWNAARFTTTFELPDDAGLGAVRSDPFALDALVMSRLDEVNDFDLWIMHIVNDMIYTVDKLMGKFSLGEASHQLVGDIWQYFCDWYIEIAKISPSPMTTAVLRVCLYKFLQLLHPFAPFVTHQLWQHLGFGTELMMTPWPTQWELPNKNYKISLLMDIITAYRVLRTKATNKSHEKVNIAFQAGTAMSDYIREHELLVRRLVHVNEVQYISDKESIPTDYTTDVVVDMVLGVEVVHTISKAEQLANLREEKSSEEQFLHNVRKMLSNVKFVSQAPKDVIATKRKKMEEVKARIEALDIEIRRLQM
jgi:valyl-tRNA synthetase